MKFHTLNIALLTLAGTTSPVGVWAKPMDCLIQPHQTIQVGSAVPGIIDEMAVERGDLIEKGQVVAQLQNSVELAALRLAKARAKGQSEMSAASKSKDFAKRELRRASELANQRFVSPNYVDKASTDASIAGAKLQQARERRQLARIELQVAQAQLAQRTIVSPISGVVVDRYLSAGEFVDERPVARIAQIDPLRVEVVVPAVYFGQLKTGVVGTVTPQFQGAQTAQATVSVVDRVVDAASNTFRVRLVLPNPDGEIPAGLRCQVDLGLNSDPVTDQTGARPARQKSAGTRG